MTPSLMFVGASANAGKTIFTWASCRLFNNRGFRVAPFKPLTESTRQVTRDGLCLDFRTWFLGDAARTRVSALNEPVQVRRFSPDSGTLYIGTEPLGTVPLAAEDVPLLDDLNGAVPRVMAAVDDAYQALAADSDVVVIEGSGSCADLAETVDIANEYAARLSGAAVVLVSSAHVGGAVSGLRGCLLEMSEALRRLVFGIAVNDARAGAAGTSWLEKRARRVADEFGINYLGAMPHLSIYDNAPPDRRSILPDEEAESEYLAEQFGAHIDVGAIERTLFGDRQTAIPVAAPVRA
jgi:adenosylcobyric acid synthase